MSAVEKVECPICGKYFSKLGINTHVNSCLNATENEFDTQFENQTNSETLSPPRKVQRLGSSEPDSSIPQSDPEKMPVHQSQAVGCSQGNLEPKQPTNCPTEGATVRQQPTQNAFDKLWKRSPKSDAGSGKTSSSKVVSNLAPSFKSSSPQKRKMSPGISYLEQKRPSVTKTDTEQEVNMNNNVLSAKAGPLTEHRAKSMPEQVSVDVKPSSGHGDTKKPAGSHIPLAERMRPLTLEGYIGQEHVIGRNKMLRRLLVSHNIPSMILWGPPGCGKTTLAKIISARSKEAREAHFVTLSATTAGVADVKDTIKIAKNDYKMFKRKTILFVDEIHRFNKLQQDTFLPHVEDGTIVLIGATTENPSFQINSALLSRCKVIVLEKLSTEHVERILLRASEELHLAVVEGSGECPPTDSLAVEKAALECLAGFCDGDARMALNSLQTAVDSKNKRPGNHGHQPGGSVVTVDDIKDSLQRSHLHYDRKGEEHYNCSSALIKSIRGSDDNAAIYWMSRMLEGGEDPTFIARRLVVAASEDIGVADPLALPLAMSCFQACNVIGHPESAINLAHCTTYLARAPKSNESYMAMRRARESIKNHEGPLPGVPLHLRNAPTKLMKNLGYGAGYKYSHEYSRESENQRYLPQELGELNFFQGKN